MQFEQFFAKTPEQIPVLFMNAWNKGDAVGIANLFVEDAEFVNVVGLWWHERYAIWKAHDYGLRVIFPNSTLEIRQVRTKIQSNEIATVHVRMKLSGQSMHASAKKVGSRQNIFTFVVRKEPKGWVCVAAHNTDIVPGKETNIIDESGQLKAVDYRK